MIRVAIIGAGPSGLFVMDQLLRENSAIYIDLFDKLPSPYGLLRTGVAPDHQTIKNLQAYYEKIFDRFPNQINFYGNIKIGDDLSIEEMKPFYTALFICTGSESDRDLNIPGNHLAGVVPSRHMVRWYNCHPHYDLHPADLQGDAVGIIGIGNVSVDIARLLLKPIKDIEQSDISDRAITTLKQSKVKHVHMFARRSPVQAAFTAKEFNELISLPNLDVAIDTKNMSLNDQDHIELDKSSKAKSNIELIQSISNQPSVSATKKLTIHFYSQPVEFVGNNQLSSITFEKTQLTGDPHHQKAIGTNTFFSVDCSAVFLSIGYIGIKVKGIPFDDKLHIIPNQHGRITDNNLVLQGLYTSGWIKRGAQGVVGTNRADAKETVASFFEDLDQLPTITKGMSIEDILTKHSCKWISYQDWLKLNAYELKLGQEKKKARVKFSSIDAIMTFLKK